MSEVDDKIAALEAELAPLRAEKAQEAQNVKQRALNKLDELRQTIIAACTEAKNISDQYYLEFEVVIAPTKGWGEATSLKLDGYGEWKVTGERDEAWESSSMNC